MSVLLMGKGARNEDKELASSIMAGEMKNAWQVEDRVTPDTRPAVLRPCRGVLPTKAYRDNYDRIFRRDGNG